MKFIFRILRIFFYLTPIAVIIIAGVLYKFYNELPDISVLDADYENWQKWELPTEIYAYNSLKNEYEIMGTIADKRRTIAYIHEIPENLKNAFLAAEDDRFYNHKGIVFRSIVRAFLANLAAGRKVQGASTISQQLAKVMFLDHERTYTRKLKEFLLAWKLETVYSKDEILERYLNKIDLGHFNFGIHAASSFYFGKEINELTLAECSLLASLPKGPWLYSPLKNPELTRERMIWVMNRMRTLNFIDKNTDITKEADEFWENYFEERDKRKAAAEARHINYYFGNYFAEEVRRDLVEKYGYNAVYKGGLKVYTTCEVNIQKYAEEAVKKFLEKRKNPPELSIVVIDHLKGELKALIGGSGYSVQSQFNRATQAERQPGSAFKPVTYIAALESGITNADKLLDIPYQARAGGRDWTPKNYTGEYYGEVSLRFALKNSLNVATVRLSEKVGLHQIINAAVKLGITSPLKPYKSLSIGSFEVKPIELVNAYTAFANGGRISSPVLIHKVVDRNGRILEQNTAAFEYAVNSQSAYVLTDVLKDVIKSGTARNISRRIFFPAAGKTGTTDNYKDAWFIGYTPDITAGVWIGYDVPASMGRSGSGGSLAAPVWADFMTEIYKNNLYPVRDFPVPEGVIEKQICAESGKLARAGCPALKEVFIYGTDPSEYCPQHVFSGPSGVRIY